MGGLILGVILTILIGVAGMAGMMGGMGRMMMRNMCGYQGFFESPDTERVTNQQE